MRLFTALVSALCASRAQAQAVFAHFMVSNTAEFGLDDWKHEISLAKTAGIDAFALNMANGESTTSSQLPHAFDAADALGFKLFFSFDYAGNGPWPKSLVISMIQQYASKPAYFYRGSQPFVSTFEGPDRALDWIDIKAVTGCFFIPDWSSIGAQPAAATGIVDGLFSWDAWPKGPANMTTYPDASYYDFLDGKPYMMPVSPWFYTNLPGFNKNWLWRGDDLWFHRWQQVVSLDRRPDYVQIISWNDYGESHYIGPLDDRQYEAFERGRAPFNYVEDMPHDGWRDFLPYIISLYKTGNASVTQEGIVSWYRLNPHGACSDGGTVGNTASQLQLEFWPDEITEDRIFYSALLTSPAEVTVSIGGSSQVGGWDLEPHGKVGLYHGSVPFDGATGSVVVSLRRKNKEIGTIYGASITTSCTNGITNYNPWVGSAKGPAIDAVRPPGNLFDWECVDGFGVYEFSGLCDFSCRNGYCDSAACVCMKKGVAHPPNITGDPGYPLPGKSASFTGLCSFNCNHGYCPDTVCGPDPNEGSIPTSSPFLPPTCTHGTGVGAFAGLCDFSCVFGYCPKHVCSCTKTGPLVPAPPKENVNGFFLDGTPDYGLCNFACSHGYCPDVCGKSEDAGSIPVFFVGTEVYATPTVACESPCVMVFAPSPLGNKTTIVPPAYTTSLEVGSTTTVVTLHPKPVTTNRIPFSNVNVTGAVTDGIIYRTLTSVVLEPVTVNLTYVTSSRTVTSTRELQLPPWPQMTGGPPQDWTASLNITVTPTSFQWPEETETTTTELPPPVWTEYPPFVRIHPIEDEVEWKCSEDHCPAAEEDEDSVTIIVPCDGLWFFIFCINTDRLKVKGWRLRLPKGTIGPGPPPFPPQLPEWSIHYPYPPLPPWPRIKVGPGGVQYPRKDPSCEDNKISVPVEMYTMSYGLSVSDGTTVTTTTRTITETAYDTGCPIPEYTSTSACSIMVKHRAMRTISPRNPALSTSIPKPETLASRAGEDDVPDPEWVHDMDCPGQETNTVIYFENGYRMSEAARVVARLHHAARVLGGPRYEVFSLFKPPPADMLFIYVWDMPRSLKEAIEHMRPVSFVYPKPIVTDPVPDPAPSNKRDSTFLTKPESLKRRFETTQSSHRNKTALLHDRDETEPLLHPYSWHRSQISHPPGELWHYWGEADSDGSFDLVYEYYHDDTLGAGQTIYLMEEGLTLDDPDYAGANIHLLSGRHDIIAAAKDLSHGDRVAKLIIGNSVGLVPLVRLVTFDRMQWNSTFDHFEVMVLIGLMEIIADIENEANPQHGKCVINISLSMSAHLLYDEFYREFWKLLNYIEEELSCVIVAAAGNLPAAPGHNFVDDTVPQTWKRTREYDPAGDLPNLVLAGASSQSGHKAKRSKTWRGSHDAGIIYAPGLKLELPLFTGQKSDLLSGTSYAAALTSGLVAYLRALKSPYQETLQDPKHVTKLINYFARKVFLQLSDGSPTQGTIDKTEEDQYYQPKIIWNGNVGKENCLTGYSSERAKLICDKYLSNIPRNLDDWNDWVPNPPHIACPLGTEECGGTNGDDGITWSQGEPSPTCSTECGTLCGGYYCAPRPTGNPPDFGDPVNNPTVTANVTKVPDSTCTAATPSHTNLPTQGACTNDYEDCGDFVCPACEWAGCVVNPVIGRSNCRCLKTSGAPPTGEAARSCKIDYDCAMFSCPPGQWSSCTGGLIKTCRCAEMFEQGEVAQDCTVGHDCIKYICPKGKWPGCGQISSFPKTTCHCYPLR